ncbi:MAG: hypothetical protein L6V90_07675 [Treponema succinifaciens]|nr:MAG: hypothetical protein L6V90_07675 [Treponema succinifaciens]
MSERKLFNFFRDVLPAGFNSRCVSVLKRGFRVLNKSLALVGVGLKIVFSVGEPAADVSGRFASDASIPNVEQKQVFAGSLQARTITVPCSRRFL